MLIGVVSSVFVAGAGFAGLRLLGIGRGSLGLGLAPAVGLALLAVLSTWALYVRAPEVVVGAGVVGICLGGLALEVRGWLAHGDLSCLWTEQRLTASLLISALVIPLGVLSTAVFVQAGVPDYIHDGATHAELVDALRHGVRLPGFDWYPVGFHAPAAAMLSLLPWVDSASGAVGWALSLTLLAPLSLFGFALAVCRDPRVAAAGALLLVLTSAYPYGTHLYSVWPMAAGMVLVLGLFTATLEYLANPSPRLAVLAGMLAAGLMLTHGTEVYTVAIGIVAFALARVRHIASMGVVRHVSLALACAVLLMAPYLPTLGGWVDAGGAVSVGAGYFDFRHTLNHADPVEEGLFWASAISSGFLVDLPVRLALLALGAWLAFRRRSGRTVVWLAALFTLFVALFRYVDAPPVRAVFALTLPWGVDDRMAMTLSVLAAPLSGFGLICLADYLARKARTVPPGGSLSSFGWRRAARLSLMLGLTLAVASVILVAEKFSLQTGGIVTYASDDATAQAWLRQHVQPGEVLLNDGAADAGIWAPYKANVAIVLRRTQHVAPDGPELLLRVNLAQIASRADVREAACRLGVAYVFRGEGNSPSEYREFPDLAVLRAIPVLEEIFSSGDAAIFRTHLNCAS